MSRLSAILAQAAFCSPLLRLVTPQQAVRTRWSALPGVRVGFGLRPQATYPSGRIKTAVGAVTAPSTGSSHCPLWLDVDQLNPIRPWSDVEAAGLTEVEQDRPGIVQQGEDPERAIGGDQVEIGHAASEQRVSLAEVVVDVQTEHHRREASARLVRHEELGNGVAQGLRAFVRAAEGDVRHRGAQHAGAGRVTLGVVGIEEAFRRCPVDHLGELPAQVHRVLHAGLEALCTVWRMHVRGVAGEQDPSVAVGRGLPGHIVEPGDPGGTVDPVVGPVDGDQRLADITQGGFACGSDVLFGHHDPNRPAVCVDHLAVADLVLRPAEGMHAAGVVADAQFRLLGQLDLGDQGAGRRIPAGELDSGCLADRSVLRRTRRDIPPAATGPRTARRRRRFRPVRNPSPRVRDRSSPAARRPSRPVCARCGSARARASRGAGWGIADVQRAPANCPTRTTCPSEMKRSAIPR